MIIQDTSHALRGGSWYNSGAAFVRAAIRSCIHPRYRYSFVGFRCAV